MVAACLGLSSISTLMACSELNRKCGCSWADSIAMRAAAYALASSAARTASP